MDRIRDQLERFRELVEKNNEVLELIADAGEQLGGEYIFDIQYLKTLHSDLADAVRRVVDNLNIMTRNRYQELSVVVSSIEAEIQAIIEARVITPKADLVLPMAAVNGEAVESVGEKLARLGEIRQRLGCLVPDGFVISAYACQRLLAEVFADQEDEGWFRLEDVAGDTLSEKASQIRDRVVRAQLPRDLGRAIQGQLSRLRKAKIRQRTPYLALRSSALGEDGELSFAGQYRTMLGVSPEQVAMAYKEVLASLFSATVMRYRLDNGLPPTRGQMAVGCLCLVEASSSGVLYTLDPLDPGSNTLLVSATRGLGKSVVEGTDAIDRYVLSRESPHGQLSRTIAKKEQAWVATPGRGVARSPVPEAQQDEPAVSGQQLQELASAALRIERYMKCAQDIEWAVDADGRMFILQARPLRLAAEHVIREHELSEVISKYPPLLRNHGTVACRGIGYGRVHIVTHDDDMDNLPEEVVLVSRVSTPRLASALARASAVLTDIGSATGHLAAIAREFRVPTIVDMKVATEALAEVEEVTVDAEDNIVFAGEVPELLHHQLVRSSSYEDAAEFRMLRKMLTKIAPLNLKDPSSRGFSAANCATYHDIIRFAHEKAVEEIVAGHWVNPSSRSRYVRRLKLEIPIDLVLVDLGGALQTHPDRTTAREDSVRSEPLRAVIEGLTTEGAWATEPADMDVNGFMSSATRSGPLMGPLSIQPEQNLAIASDRYLNLNLKLGYHYNIIDCYLTETRNDNFIYFRFAGGVTEELRRSRRAALLRLILERHDFVVEVREDLVIGRIKKISRAAMVERLRMIGRLVGFTRQLDIYLRDDERVERCASDFLAGKYSPYGA